MAKKLKTRSADLQNRFLVSGSLTLASIFMTTLESECLKLNSRWIPIGVVTVRKAFEDAFAGAATLLRFHEGYPTPYRIEDWINIPIDDKDEYVTTGNLHAIRKIAVPRVMISVNFDRIIAKEQKLNLRNLAKRYKSTCAVSGKKLKPDQWSREHTTPKSKGGKDGWENEVLMDRDLNSRRGNRTYTDAGLKEPQILKAPRPLLPINIIVNKHGYAEWDMFSIPRETT